MGVGRNGNLIPPKKGEVRNPKGKPKGSYSLKPILRRILREKDPEDGRKLAEKFIRARIESAIKGNSFAAREIWEYIDGKPSQAVEMSTPPGQPMELIVDLALHRGIDADDKD